MGKSIRIHTTPGGDDKFVSVKIDQDFDFLEVLSIKIQQEEIYRQYCADYGVLVGRVLINDGFGAPNCKVSIFIPLDEIDEDNTLLSTLYPFKSPTDQDDQFIRYNLLPSSKQNFHHKVVGTFSDKRGTLNNDIHLEIYDKYYKFTTVTNDSGDFMIFGIPVGNQMVHFDLDLADMGDVSLTPADLIASGVNENEFTSESTDAGTSTTYRFKTNANLDILPQIKSLNQQVNIRPFWGNEEQCEIGITRLDWNVEGIVLPSAIVFFSIFYSDEHISRCGADPGHPFRNNKIGFMEQMGIRDVSTDVYRLDDAGNPEFFTTHNSDSDGNFVFSLPMNNGRVITDSAGTLVASTDDNGIPTYGDYRFHIKFQNENLGSGERIASFFAPNYTYTSEAQAYTPTPVPLPEGANTYYLGFFSNGRENYQRLKAGTVNTIGQLIPESKRPALTFYKALPFGSSITTSNPRQYQLIWNAEQNTPAKLNHPWNHEMNWVNFNFAPIGQKAFYMNKKLDEDVWESNKYLPDNCPYSALLYKWGSIYAPSFQVGNKSAEHPSATVYGATEHDDEDDGEIGGQRSLGPYYYRFGLVGKAQCNLIEIVNGRGPGSLKVLDLTAQFNPNWNFFNDVGKRLDSGIPASSNNNMGNINQQTYSGQYFYFGIFKGRTSLDIVKTKYSL